MIGYFIVAIVDDGIVYDALRYSILPLSEIEVGKDIWLNKEGIIFCSPIKAMLFLNHHRSLGWSSDGRSYIIYEVVVDETDFIMVKELPEGSLRSWLEQFLPKEGMALEEVYLTTKLYIRSIKIEMRAKNQKYTDHSIRHKEINYDTERRINTTNSEDEL